MRNKHHILPRSRDGGNERENIILLRIERHESWHLLFGDKAIDEVIGLLIRVHRIKGRCTKPLTGFCTTEAMYCDRRQDSNVYPALVSEQGTRMSGVGSSFDKFSPDDKLVDLWIALESLFAPDIDSEIKFRGALRIARFLCRDNKMRQEIYDDMRHSYDWRSAIVHGSGDRRRKDLTKKGDLEEVLQITCAVPF